MARTWPGRARRAEDGDGGGGGGKSPVADPGQDHAGEDHHGGDHGRHQVQQDGADAGHEAGQHVDDGVDAPERVQGQGPVVEEHVARAHRLALQARRWHRRSSPPRHGWKRRRTRPPIRPRRTRPERRGRPGHGQGAPGRRIGEPCGGGNGVEVDDHGVGCGAEVGARCPLRPADVTERHPAGAGRAAARARRGPPPC